MTKDSNYLDDLECYEITDKIHSHYRNIQDSDDEEAQRIAGKAFGYLMQFKWDDITLSMEELSNSIHDTAKEIHTTVTNQLGVFKKW